MRQILYVSDTASRGNRADLCAILEQSQANNARDGISGLLWWDGEHFLQVFEGPEAQVEACWQRIQRDSRHRNLIVLRDVAVDVRAFGNWTMAYRHECETADHHDAVMRQLLSDVSPEISNAFLAMVAMADVDF